MSAGDAPRSQNPAARRAVKSPTASAKGDPPTPPSKQGPKPTPRYRNGGQSQSRLQAGRARNFDLPTRVADVVTARRVATSPKSTEREGQRNSPQRQGKDRENPFPMRSGETGTEANPSREGRGRAALRKEGCEMFISSPPSPPGSESA